MLTAIFFAMIGAMSPGRVNFPDWSIVEELDDGDRMTLERAFRFAAVVMARVDPNLVCPKKLTRNVRSGGQLVPGQEKGRIALVQKGDLRLPDDESRNDRKKRKKQHRLGGSSSAQGLPIPSIGAPSLHASIGSRGGEVVATVTTSSSPSITARRRSWTSPTLPVPLTTVSWIYPWRRDASHWDFAVGGQGPNGERVVLFEQDADNEVFVQFAVADIAGATVQDFRPALTARSCTPSGHEFICLVDRSADKILAVHDTTGDGLPDKATTFASDSRLDRVDGFYLPADPTNSFFESAYVELAPPTNPAPRYPFVRETLTFVDSDGDLVADQLVSGDTGDRFPPSPRITLRSHLFDDAGRWIDLIVPGSTEIAVEGGGAPGQVFQVFNWNAPGVAMGVATPASPETWAVVPLSTPLQVGDFLGVTSPSFPSSTSLAVVGLEEHGSIAYSENEIAGPVWDVDDDGDFDFVEQIASCLYIGLCEGGAVVETRIVVLPVQVGGVDYDDLSDSIGFTSIDELDVAPLVDDRLRRFAGSPIGIAQRVGDVVTGGDGNDAVVLLQDPATAEIVIHWRVGGTWSSLAVPTSISSTGVDSYSVHDSDGDFDLDIVLNGHGPGADNLTPRHYLCLWNAATGAFELWTGPTLTLIDTEFPAGSGIESVYHLELQGVESPGVQVGYVMGLSASGSMPGVTLQGVHVPLNPDTFTDLSLAAGNSPFTVNFQGDFGNATQSAEATLCVPSTFMIPAGTNITAAYVAYDIVNGGALAASNPTLIHVVAPPSP